MAGVLRTPVLSLRLLKATVSRAKLHESEELSTVRSEPSLLRAVIWHSRLVIIKQILENSAWALGRQGEEASAVAPASSGRTQGLLAGLVIDARVQPF
jgi:hypothetical protein